MQSTKIVFVLEVIIKEIEILVRGIMHYSKDQCITIEDGSVDNNK